MPLIPLLAGLIFIASYGAIALEHPLKVSKSAIALCAGALLWILVAISGRGDIKSEMAHAGADVFSIVIFLLAAMSLVEVLVHYRFFDVIRGKLFALKLSEGKQFLVITLITFFLSAVVDNLTTTIIMIQISRKFFKNENMLVAAVGIVISANAGGAFSPIGDVTTIMLWFAEKFSGVEIIVKGFLPSFALYLTSTALLYRRITPSQFDYENEIVTTFGRSEKFVIALVFASFTLPLFTSLIDLPPYVGLLLGLGIVWLVVDGLKRIAPKETHLSASIEDFLKKIDIPSLKFFVGILLAVSALSAVGVLDYMTGFIYGHGTASETSIVVGNIALGLLPSILDNVPLTAIAIQILDTTNVSLWVLLALCVGTGGSLLVIGSAAGVVAMGMVKELSFYKYFKIAFVPALSGFIVGVGVWALQNYIFGF